MNATPCALRATPCRSRRDRPGARCVLTLHSYRGDTGLHESSHECRRWRLGEWKPDRPLRGLVSLECFGMGTPDGRRHRVQAAVVFPGRVPDERPSIEPEGRDSVAETLDGAGSRGANGRAQLLEPPAGIGRQRRKVGSHLLEVTRGLLSLQFQSRTQDPQGRRRRLILAGPARSPPALADLPPN